MDTSRPDRLLSLLRQGPTTAAVLGQRLGISQPTVSRLLATLGTRIIRIGRARATRYALARDIGHAGSRWPLYRLDAEGRAHRLGELRALHGGGFHLQAEQASPALLHPPFEQGLFPDLPWFLDDLRPQGFLGRAFARRVAQAMAVPADPRLWQADDVILALLHHGHDLPGDLLLGEAALEHARARDRAPAIAADACPQQYPAWADAVLRGEAAGSSAAGEQPKFAVDLLEGGQHRAVIVKFSPVGTHPAAVRWADLLCCEHLAGDVLRAHGLSAADSRLLDAGGRRFLESTRFDRTPAGRLGFVSLAALDAVFHGHGRIDWWRYATQLQAEGWLAPEDARHLRVLGWFGALIANHDMHLGNVGLHLRDALPLRLAPAYDMLPMLFRPTESGEVIERTYAAPLPLPEQAADWHAAAELATAFWTRAARDDRISDGFRRLAESARTVLENRRRNA